MSSQEKRLKNVQVLARWLDNKYRILGTTFHIGMDGLLGLIPGVGDTITAALSGWIIYQAHRCEVSFGVKLRMAWNMAIDWLIGLIPLVGDIFDIGWQANQKNAALLARHMEKQQEIRYL